MWAEDYAQRASANKLLPTPVFAVCIDTANRKTGSGIRRCRIPHAPPRRAHDTLQPQDESIIVGYSLVDVLPTLSAGECLIVGDAAPLPAVIKMDMPNPIPNSSNVNVYDEWNKNWIDIAFETVIKRWWKE